LDKRIAVVGTAVFAIVGITLLVKISQPLYGVSSLLACLACVGYLFLRGRATLQVEASDEPLLYDLGWLAAWATAIAAYALRPEPYERPLAFFVFVAISCGFVAAKIIRCRMSGRDTAVTLVQTIAIGLSLVWTVTLMYPSLVGLDPWTHRSIVLNGLDNGWSTFPVWHGAWYSFIATVIKSTGLEYRLATMAVSFTQVAAGISLLFLIGRRVIGTRVGLLAALVAAFSSWHIFFGYWIIPNGMGLTLLLLAVYLAIRYNDSQRWWEFCAFIGTLALLLLTYPLAVVWLIVLLCIWLVLTLVRDRHLPKRRIVLPLAGILATLGVLWKIGFLRQLYDIVIVYGLNPARIGTAPLPGIAPPTTGAPPPMSIPSGTFFLDTIAQPSWEFAFNSLGMVLGFVVAIAGCLGLLHKYYRNTPSLFIVLSLSFFLIVGIVPALFGVSVIEHRWWYAAQAFGAIPAAVAIIAIHKVGKGVVVAIAVAALSFLMMVGLPCNMDNYTFSQNQLARYALTQGELEAAEWALGEYEGDIGVDNYYTFATNMLPGSNGRLVGINTEILVKDYSSLNCSIVLMRDAVAYEPFALGEGRVYKLLYDPNEALTESGYKLVYNADGVNGYVKNDAGTAILSVNWTKGSPADQTVILGVEG